MSKDGRVKTTYDKNEVIYEPFVHVVKQGGKPFYIIYQSNYFLGKALEKLKRSKTLRILNDNYKRY